MYKRQGHTGATVVAAHAVFGMLPGVDRPALAPAIPTRTGMAVLLDAGATVECLSLIHISEPTRPY